MPQNKKFLNDNSGVIPDNERLLANPETKQLGENAVNKFEEEKNKGKKLQHVESGDILGSEVNAINEHKCENPQAQHVELWGNREHNTIMAQYPNPDGAVAEEITSSGTPENVVREEYHDGFRPLNVTNSEYQMRFYPSPSSADALNSGPASEGPSDESSSLETSSNKSFESEDLLNLPATSSEILSNPHKRKRDDDESDGREESSSRRVTEDMVEDTISSIYDLAGDD